MRAITWRKTGVYVLVVLPVLGLVGIAAIAQQQATSQEGSVDPVAEAARKAREQKKAEPKPKKVFTNDDLGSAAPAPAAATNAPAATTSGSADTKENAEGTANGDKDVAGEKSAGVNKNGEEAWRKRFREARDKLAQAEQELDILQRESQKSQVQYYTDPQKALSEQYSRKDISEKDTKIDAKKQEVAQMKQRIADLEDQLRKSGGDPGWAR
jgi:hypothetical protein